MDDRFNLTGLEVTSTINPPYGTGQINTNFNASIQQNFFLANSFGAPIYWIQNVIYIYGTPGDWAMNLSGWSVFPFYGLYPNAAVYNYNFPVVGLNLSTPLSFNIETQLKNTTELNNQSVEYPRSGSPGRPHSGSRCLAPRTSWEICGTTTPGKGRLTRKAGFPGPRRLSPQFGLVGGPSGGTGNFLAPTAGDLQATFERFGGAKFIPGATKSFLDSSSQTGEDGLEHHVGRIDPREPYPGHPCQLDALVFERGGHTRRAGVRPALCRKQLCGPIQRDPDYRRIPMGRQRHGGDASNCWNGRRLLLDERLLRIHHHRPLWLRPDPAGRGRVRERSVSVCRHYLRTFHFRVDV